MAYIGNNTNAGDIIKQELYLTSTDKRGTIYYDMGGGETEVNNSPTDAFNISLNNTITDCNSKNYYVINLGTFTDTVDLGTIA